MVLAAVGLGTTAYAAVKGEERRLWITLGYFSLMELLQAFTYIYIDECSSGVNQVLTLFGYFHIAFQPFFINAFSMYFIPKDVRKRIEPAVYTLCFASAIFMLVQLQPMDWAGVCIKGRSMCGEVLCSIHGNWHIGWSIPYNGMTNNLPEILVNPTYIFTAFLLPVLYGSWRMTVYHYIMGPTLAYALTQNPYEFPAVWCLLSIGFLLIIVKTPLRKILFVKTWPLWSLLGLTWHGEMKAAK
jgi:hypothetical protein